MDSHRVPNEYALYFDLIAMVEHSTAHKYPLQKTALLL